MWSKMKKGMLFALLVCMMGLCSCGRVVEDDRYSTEVFAGQVATEVVRVENVIADLEKETKSEVIGEVNGESVGQWEVEGESEIEELDIAPAEITIRMAGDILLHDRVSQYARQEDGTYWYDGIFDDLEEEIEGADLAIVNQEVIIAGEEFGVSGYPCFNAPFEMGDALVEAGFDVVCHGTNHALDQGKDGLLSCIDFWKTEYPEIGVLGIHETAGEQDEIYIFEQDGIKVAVLNYTYGTNGIPLPADMPYAVDLLRKEKVVADIEKAEMLADFTIVCPHWGTEYVLEETKAQQQWAEVFLEHGVDLVLGTHPHVIEPIEILCDEETGHEMLVYYSLGNFVNWTSSSGQGIANRMVGGMADVTIGRDAEGDVVVKDYAVTAVVTHLESRVNGIFTTRLSEYTQEQALKNEIVMQDPAFSKEYCVELCDKVWGELWE